MLFQVKSDNERLDILLAKQADISRAEAQKLIEEKKVKVNQDIIIKKNHRLKKEDTVETENKTQHTDEINEKIEAENIPLNIVYEDDDIFIINKPEGIIIHPGSGVKNGTIANAVAYYLKDTSHDMPSFRPGIVHRLDKDTSGLLIIAKNKKAQSLFSQMFEKREIKKYYLTCVYGKKLPLKGTINAPIERDPTHRTKMTVSPRVQARKALTHFDVLEQNENFSFIKCHIITGRTHQIRIHFSSINNPVIGDKLYGNKKINDFLKKNYELNRQFLHAYELYFTHPISQKKIHITCELPNDLESIKNDLFGEKS